MKKTTLEISWTSLWRVFFFVLLVALAYSGRDILIGLFLAIVISSGVETVISYLERWGIPRTLGVILVFLFLAAVAVLVLYTFVPLLIVSLNTALLDIQKAAGNAWWRQFFNIKAARSINELMNRLITQFFSSGASPLELFSQVLGGVTLTISVFIVSFYLSLSQHGIERFIRAMFPSDYQESALDIYRRSRHKIGFWLRAQVVMSVAMGLLVWITLSFLGVPYALFLGALTAIVELVPFVGPIISGGASVLVAFSSSTTLGVYTIIAFLILQQFESNILVPFLTRRAVGLHPVVVIVAILIGIEISGFLGAIIAIPAAAVFQEAIESRAERKMSVT